VIWWHFNNFNRTINVLTDGVNMEGLKTPVHKIQSQLKINNLKNFIPIYISKETPFLASCYTFIVDFNKEIFLLFVKTLDTRLMEAEFNYLSHFIPERSDLISIPTLLADSLAEYKSVGLLTSLRRNNMKYLHAKDRYLTLRMFLVEANALPEILVFYSEACYMLDALEESFRVLQRLQSDEFVGNVMAQVTARIEKEKVSDEEYVSQHGFSGMLINFRRPMECPRIAFEDCTEIARRWQSLQGLVGETRAIDEFRRHACIASNVVEDVFDVTGSSWTKLVRLGYVRNSIEGFSTGSKLKQKNVVVRILNNTLTSLTAISACLDDLDKFNNEFMKTIHDMMLHDDHFVEEMMEDADGHEYPVIQLITKGAFRNKACLVFHNDKTEITQFCHHAEISNEMNRYCELGKLLLRDPLVDPFVKAAWLQWAFLRIHPFEDGNGRIARIVSSIPLAAARLPPIVVTKERKAEYFNCLHAADRNNDLRPLVLFLRTSLMDGIVRMETFNSEKVIQSTATAESGSTTTRARRKSGSSSSSESSPDSPKPVC
jgi:fido (protein-threonine AMPylation protein)